MKLSLTKNLAPIRDKACAQIDQLAEKCRGRYITLGAGQAMIYLQKEREAEMVSADPNVNPNLVPHVVQEATAAGISLLDMAAIILTRAQEWRNISPSIELTRLATKQQIMAATTPAGIETLIANARAYYEQNP